MSTQISTRLNSPIFVSPGGKSISDREIDIVMNYLKPSSGMRILDAGIGTGRIAYAVKDKGAEVIGFDLEVKQVTKTTSDFKSIGDDSFEAVAADIQFIPFADASFDAVLCFRVLKYVPDYHLALTELHRVLKPGGRLVLEISNLYSWEVLLDAVRRLRGLPPVVRHYFVMKRIMGLLEQQNFVIINSAPTYKIPFIFWRLSKNSFSLNMLLWFHGLLLKATPKDWLSRGIIFNCILKKQIRQEH